ncbi:hypothetical protein QWY85_04905 [Neolewinella lacunae]|uniref:Uncharacterized protein n=1 Tax=Neolewinella lacunae TaxID=1517758 RepID=A0A923PL98_9BACT|nr:hypothetical protein [Neolewinella lacunae]MBC6996135.1 hypothetical protein [Neolewinella lacunae]MDN3633988.1 hypothetical protein [Neolewinella lacunae]
MLRNNIIQHGFYIFLVLNLGYMCTTARPNAREVRTHVAKQRLENQDCKAVISELRDRAEANAPKLANYDSLAGRLAAVEEDHRRLLDDYEKVVHDNEGLTETSIAQELALQRLIFRDSIYVLRNSEWAVYARDLEQQLEALQHSSNSYATGNDASPKRYSLGLAFLISLLLYIILRLRQLSQPRR